MSANQWKLLVHLKDTFNKLSNDKSIQNVLNHELFQSIQRLSNLTTINITRYFENTKKTDKKIDSNLPSLIQSLQQTSENQDVKDKANKPDWKKKERLTKSAIFSQTQHVILSIESAETDPALLQRLESFIAHIKQYPEGRNSAIRIGAIRLLLQKRLNNKNNNEIQGCIREALALLGYADPVPMQGVRILSMDGGGIRGLLVLEMLKKLEELTGRRTHELFDLFCGVSTGAILSFLLAIHRRHIDEIAEGYKAISNEVFRQSPLWGTSNLMWTQSYYDTDLWENKLREYLGTKTLISTSRDPSCPKVCAVSAIVNQSHLSAHLFRNYTLPWRVKSQYFGSHEYELWQAARASAAAPTYFEEFKLGNYIHQDGGILVNNPTAVALHEAKLIWPDTPIQCVVSFGTGRTVPPIGDITKESLDNANSTSWANKFYKILDSATDTEGVHIMLNDLLPENIYYRFNPYLTEMLSMVEIDQRKLEQLKRDAVMYLRRNEEKFQQAAFNLMKQKSLLQKTKDYLNYKRDLYGF